MRKHGPRGMAVTSRPRKRTRPYRTRLTGRLMLIHEGFGVNAPDPSPFQAYRGHPRAAFFALPAPYPAFIAELSARPPVRGNVLICALSCIRTASALAVVAIAVAGCAAANNATSAQASGQGEQPYKTMYGMSSDGPTTDLYTELFGPRQPPPAPATNVAAAQPIQPVTSQPIDPVQPNMTAPHLGQAATATTPNRQGQTTAANRAPQPAYGQPAPVQPVQVAQQPAPPQPPPEPDVPAAYGITANGPTTDLYTEIFGPRRSNGQ